MIKKCCKKKNCSATRVEIEIRALAGPDKVALFYLQPG